MRYYRDVDYFIYFEEFPHMGISGVITANSDGTSNIYINTLYSAERQREAIKHELRHLVRQHQYCDWKSLEEKEAEAEEDDTGCIFGEDFSYAEYEGQGTGGRLPDVFREKPPGTIPIFTSLESLKGYMNAMREQYVRERRQARLG